MDNDSHAKIIKDVNTIMQISVNDKIIYRVCSYSFSLIKTIVSKGFVLCHVVYQMCKPNSAVCHLLTFEKLLIKQNLFTFVFCLCHILFKRSRSTISNSNTIIIILAPRSCRDLSETKFICEKLFCHTSS